MDEARLGCPRRGRSADSPLVEDFSERELDVLRLLGGQLSQREIGDVLFISFNTVKTHSKSIYRKLGVGSRTRRSPEPVSSRSSDGPLDGRSRPGNHPG